MQMSLCSKGEHASVPLVRGKIMPLGIVPPKSRTFNCVIATHIYFKTQTNCSPEFQFGPKKDFSE